MAEPLNPEQGGRARRYALPMPLLYRPAGAPGWFRGDIINLSGTGVLFRGRHQIAPDAAIELSLELPRAITGEASVPLLCAARVVRQRSPRFGFGSRAYGAAFVSGRVVRPAAPGAETLPPSLLPPGLQHRCNNLLSVVTGNSDLILALEALDPQAREAALRIREAAHQITLLLRQAAAFTPGGAP